MSTPNLLAAAERARTFLNGVCSPPPGIGFLSGEAFDAALSVVKEDLDAAIAAWNSSELVAAARRVLASIDAHIRSLQAAGKPVPVLDGVAALYDAVGRAERREGGAS